MATSDEYAQWIVNNADKRGTPEFNTVAAAYQDSKQSTPVPKENNALLEQVRGFSKAFGHHVMNLPHGIAQGVENIVNAGAQLLPDNPASRAINSTVTADNAAMAQREKDYQASTPDSTGAYAGAITGEVLPFMANKIAAPLRAAGDYAGNLAAKNLSAATANLAAKNLSAATANLGSKIASGTTQGAIIGAAQPVTNPDYWEGKGKQVGTSAVVGGALPAVTTALSGIYNAGKNVIEPLINPTATAARKLSDATGVDPQTLAQALKNPTEYVKGSMPTTAQVIATPEAVQLEKALRNNPDFTGKMENISNANNAARLEALNSVAGAPGALDQATAERAFKAKELYQQAFSEYKPSSVTPELESQVSQLMQRPAMQSAINDAKTLAKNEGLSLTDENSVQGLHYAKMSLDDKISNAIRSGDNNAARTLTDTKNKLLDVMGNLSPTYKKAMSTYADMSKPINTMEVGQQLQDKLTSGSLNSAGDPNIAFQNFRTSLAKALKGSEYGINPEAKKTLQAIQDDLQRDTISNSLRFPGSDTHYNQQAQGWLSRQLYGKDFSGSGASTKIVGTIGGAVAGATIGHPLYGMGAGASAALGLSKLAANRVNNAMADIMTSPANAEKALTALAPSERSALVKLLSQNPMTQQLIQSATVKP